MKAGKSMDNWHRGRTIKNMPRLLENLVKHFGKEFSGFEN